MIIIGIDPGSHKTGWGVVESAGSSVAYVDSGTIIVSRDDSMSLRLIKIKDKLREVVERYKPLHAVIEEVFFCKNVKSALVLGHARGVAIVTLAECGCEKIFQYAAKRIKMSVTGRGAAQKTQVQHMVKAILGLRDRALQEDEADALACAICHASQSKNILYTAEEI